MTRIKHIGRGGAVGTCRIGAQRAVPVCVEPRMNGIGQGPLWGVEPVAAVEKTAMSTDTLKEHVPNGTVAGQRRLKMPNNVQISIRLRPGVTGGDVSLELRRTEPLGLGSRCLVV